MNPGLNSSKIISPVIQAIYIAFFISLVCSFRAISSISVGLMLIAGVIKNKIEHKSFFHSNVKNNFLAACVGFFLLQFVAFLYTHNIHETWNGVRVKSALLFMPLAVCCSGYVNTATRKKLYPYYCLIVAAASLYCLLTAFLHYQHSHDSSLFFYHALVSPFKQHAVFFSILVFIALLYLSESARKKDLIYGLPFHISLVIFLSVFLFLLSSKLVIIFYFLYLLYYFAMLIRDRTSSRAVAVSLLFLSLLAGCLIFTTRNPVSSRFNEILNGDINLVKQDKFEQGNYFNDVQFRLLEWKFVAEILNENHSWWAGVSPGDAQSLLDKKYISKNIYTGNPATGDRGFLGYNTHNQLLEALLQNGIAGSLIFLIICFTLIQMAWQKRSRILSFTIILLLAFSLNESIFERQYAIMIFTFFPLFIGLGEKRTATIQKPHPKATFFTK
jgi:hypothetical protein